MVAGRFFVVFPCLLACSCANGTARSEYVDAGDAPDAGNAPDVGSPGSPIGAGDAAPLEASTLDDAGDPCGPGGDGLLLQCASRCPASLFTAPLALEDDFGASSTYAQDWSGAYVVPTLTPSGLQFGPHPENANWWENYSPTGTKTTNFGDVLFCVRLRMHVGQDAGDNSFQISLRGGSEGMVLAYGAKSQQLGMTRKTSANDTWQQYSAGVAPLAAGEDEIELALYGRGTSFYAQMKDVASGRVYSLAAQEPALPAVGPVEMLGWELAQPLVVTRVAVGTPTADAQRRIAR
jgi:hypothetical protein